MSSPLSGNFQLSSDLISMCCRSSYPPFQPCSSISPPTPHYTQHTSLTTVKMPISFIWPDYIAVRACESYQFLPFGPIQTSTSSRTWSHASCREKRNRFGWVGRWRALLGIGRCVGRSMGRMRHQRRRVRHWGRLKEPWLRRKEGVDQIGEA